MKWRSSEIDALADFIVNAVVREGDIMSRYSFCSDLRQRADTLGKRIKMDVDLDMMVLISLDPKAVVDDIRIGVNCDFT